MSATVLWLFGGIDPTGGAGLGRDARTASQIAPGLALASFPTAQTRQGHGRPAQAEPTTPDVLRRLAAATPSPAAIKIGLVPATIVAIVHEIVSRIDAPCVVDPVLAASDGGTMGAVPAALEPLLRSATLATPNLPEARALSPAADDEGLAEAWRQRYGTSWLLLKGGHDDDPERVVDLLVGPGHRERFARARQPGPDVRGTGCALATAIACGLARGRDVPSSVADAIAWLDAARGRASPGPDGRLHLP